MNWRWRLFGRTRPMRGHSVTVQMPTFEELRASWDCDEYKRWALRARLRQAGLLKSPLVTEAGYDLFRRYGYLIASPTQRQREIRHDARVFAKYERVILPSPMVRAVRDEMRAVIVDLQQFEQRMMLRDGRGAVPVRRRWWHFN